jgi:hypothetical protein
MKKVVLSVTLLIFLAFQAPVFAQDTGIRGGDDITELAPVELTVAGNRLIWQNVQVGKKIEIYSIVGKKMGEIPVHFSSGEYTLNLPKGYYIFKVGNVVRKFAINKQW